MDSDAARRARHKTIKADLAEVYDDDEACPPEWVDLLDRTTSEKRAIRESVEAATLAFASEPDIRRALRNRDVFAERTGERIVTLNALVGRLNLLAPHARFTRAGLDAPETLRPLFRTPRGATT
jgi:hypothetical protein